MLLSSFPAIAAQDSTPTTTERSLTDTIIQQRSNATPQGESASVGDLVFTIDGFDDDAADALNPAYLIGIPNNQRVVNIAVTVTNDGAEDYVIATEHHMLIAGNRGFYRWLTPSECAVDANIRDPETTVVEPGEEGTFNACGIASIQDLDSLQLWVSAPLSDTAATDVLFTGTWFDLGGSEGFEPEVTANQAQQAASLDSVTAELDDPTNPTDPVRAGELVLELTSFSSDATDDLSEDDLADASIGDDQVPALATFRITNTGDRMLVADILLFDSTGISADLRIPPASFDDERGGVMPGGTMERTIMWVVDESAQSSLVFRLSSSGGPETSWMLTEEDSDFAWSPIDVGLADPASTDEQAPVAHGETASVLDYNVTMTAASEGDAQELTLVNASSDPNGAPINAELWSGSEFCYLVLENRPYSTFSKFTLPGTEMPFGLVCSEDAGGVVEVRLTDTDSTVHVGYFSLLAGDIATPVAVATPAIPFATPEAATPASLSTPSESIPLSAPQESTPVASPVASPVTSPSTPEDAATPSPDDTAVVRLSANVRSEPSISGAVVTVAAEGEEVRIAGEEVEADGYVWVPIVTSNGTMGWIAQDFLER
jgi:hypothetical protein